MYAIVQLAQTTMRSELGKMSLDNCFAERESLNAAIVKVGAPLELLLLRFLCCFVRFLRCWG